jgi:hypothetical protein
MAKPTLNETTRALDQLEPWLTGYAKGLRRRRQPMVWLLASVADVEHVAAGRVPLRMRRQATRLLAFGRRLTSDTG